MRYWRVLGIWLIAVCLPLLLGSDAWPGHGPRGYTYSHTWGIADGGIAGDQSNCGPTITFVAETNHQGNCAVPFGTDLHVRSFSLFAILALDDAASQCQLLLEYGDDPTDFGSGTEIAASAIEVATGNPNPSDATGCEDVLINEPGEGCAKKFRYVIPGGTWYRVIVKNGTNCAGACGGCTSHNASEVSVDGFLVAN